MTAAGVFGKSGPEGSTDREAEFLERLTQLFTAGGMMQLKQEALCGRMVTVMCRPAMDAHGIEVCYNYFEDGRRERAGYSRGSGHVWSGRLGWRQFYQVMTAAYVLKSLYLAEPSAAWVNGAWVADERYTGWINQLFDGHFSRRNGDPWPLFAALHDQGEQDLGQYDWRVWVRDVVGFIGYYEIRAVLAGTDEAAAEFAPLLAGLEPAKHPSEGTERGLDFFECVKRLQVAVREYRCRSKQEQKEQLSQIIARLRSDWQAERFALDGDSCELQGLDAICFFARLSDAPAYVLKVVSEVYGAAFWELWNQVKDVAGRRLYLWGADDPSEVEPVSTVDFLQITLDDWVLFAGTEGKEMVSPALREWLTSLGQRYHAILREGMSEMEMQREQALAWIVDLLEYAEQNYYQIYPFAEFLSETQEHLCDRRFLAVWKLYEELMQNPQMKADANVIFAAEPLDDKPLCGRSDETGTEDGARSVGQAALRPGRRLKREWDLLATVERNNPARVTLRRYMALLANRRLRRSVFGF